MCIGDSCSKIRKYYDIGNDEVKFNDILGVFKLKLVDPLKSNMIRARYSNGSA